MTSITVTSLTKRFGSKLVLDAVSFRANSGILGVAGPNGSGKTTLMRCLAGLMRPGKGQIVWQQDETVIDREHLRGFLGFAGPWLQLYRELSCLENLEFLGRLHALPRPSERAALVLEQVGLDAMASQPYGKLSSGQQQRMKLATALVHEPPALLLDEPGSNLDEAGRAAVREIVRQWSTPGRLLIIASNDADELALCDSVFSLENKLLETDP